MRQSYRSSLVALVMLALTLLPTTAFAQDAGAQAEEPTVNPDVIRYVRMETNKGDIYIALNETKAPLSTKNFLAYAEGKFYDGTIFHRVIGNFMIQGGGFDEKLKRRETQPPIANEWRNGLKNNRGTIAMARTSQPDSATSQFFINVQDNVRLDQPISGGAGYAVFGSVIVGMDVVDAIKSVETRNLSRAFANIPTEPVVIKQVREVRASEAEHAMAAEAAKKEKAKEGTAGGNGSSGRALGKPGGEPTDA